MQDDTIKIVVKENMVIFASNAGCQTLDNHSSEFLLSAMISSGLANLNLELAYIAIFTVCPLPNFYAIFGWFCWHVLPER